MFLSSTKTKVHSRMLAGFTASQTYFSSPRGHWNYKRTSLSTVMIISTPNGFIRVSQWQRSAKTQEAVLFFYSFLFYSWHNLRCRVFVKIQMPKVALLLESLKLTSMLPVWQRRKRIHFWKASRETTDVSADPLCVYFTYKCCKLVWFLPFLASI